MYRKFINHAIILIPQIPFIVVIPSAPDDLTVETGSVLVMDDNDFVILKDAFEIVLVWNGSCHFMPTKPLSKDNSTALYVAKLKYHSLCVSLSQNMLICLLK